MDDPAINLALARQRLLDAADELFYRQGMHRVSIDRVIEIIRSMAHNMTVLQKYRGAMMDLITEFVNTPEMTSEEAANLMADAVEAEM